VHTGDGLGWTHYSPIAKPLTSFSAKNIETVLINRFLMGAAGSIGATLVGGTISDIYVPAE
jgi:hypothetical protein